MVAAPVAMLLGLVAFAAALGYRLNVSASLPLGIWQNVGDEPRRGSFVTACIPRHLPAMDVAIETRMLPDGRCPGGVVPLLKRVVATEGDIVILADGGLQVSGRPIPNTATPRGSDKLPPAYPRGTYLVGKDQFWLIANVHPHSFDSRYFGPVGRADILSSTVPVAIFGSLPD